MCPHGATLLSYNEAPKTSHTVVDAEKSQAAARLWALLQEGCGTRVVARSLVRKGLTMLVKEFGDAWRLREAHRKAWITTYERRIMNNTSVVNKGCKKSRQAGPRISRGWHR